MTTERTRVDAQKLTNFSAKTLQKLGMPENDAQIAARMLVATDLRGVESHGVARLNSHYARRLRAGTINVNPKPKIFSRSPATAIMDGDGGLGFIIGYKAMMEAINRAEKTGAGFVAVRNSNHFGASALYTMMALEYDMIGISMTNGGTTVVAPGSSKPALGTNPICVAIPADKKPPFVLDMATSVIAGGKLEIAQRAGVSIPEGWAIDKEGKATTDPAKADADRKSGDGGILPLGWTPKLGAYKGFGLSVLVEILCGVLSGSMATLAKEKRGNPEHFFGAIKIDGFLPVADFKKSMDKMIEAFEALPTLPGVKKIYVAGGYEDEVEKDRKANGIPLDSQVIEDLQKQAEDLGIEFDL